MSILDSAHPRTADQVICSLSFSPESKSAGQASSILSLIKSNPVEPHSPVPCDLFRCALVVFLPHCLLAHINHLSGTYSVHVLFGFHSCCEAPYNNGWNECFGKRQTGRYKNAQAIANRSVCFALPCPALPLQGSRAWACFLLTAMHRMLYMPSATEEVRRGKAFVPRLQTSRIEVRVQTSNVVEQQ
jgi:hypothetical protein